jgi:DNA modification methylase
MLVCDPFMGSGTVGIACSRRIGVDFLGIEINEDYVKIAKERIGVYGQEKLREKRKRRKTIPK